MVDGGNHLSYLVVLSLIKGDAEPSMCHKCSEFQLVFKEVGGLLNNFHFNRRSRVVSATLYPDGYAGAHGLQLLGGDVVIDAHQVSAFMRLFPLKQEAGHLLVGSEQQKALRVAVKPAHRMCAFRKFEIDTAQHIYGVLSNKLGHHVVGLV